MSETVRTLNNGLAQMETRLVDSIEAKVIDEILPAGWQYTMEEMIKNAMSNDQWDRYKSDSDMYNWRSDYSKRFQPSTSVDMRDIKNNNRENFTNLIEGNQNYLGPRCSVEIPTGTLDTLVSRNAEFCSGDTLNIEEYTLTTNSGTNSGNTIYDVSPDDMTISRYLEIAFNVYKTFGRVPSRPPTVGTSENIFSYLTESGSNLNTIKTRVWENPERRPLRYQFYQIVTGATAQHDLPVPDSIGYTEENTFFRKNEDTYDTLLKNYRSLEEYYNSLKALIRSKKNELNKTKNKLFTYKQNLYIDGRKDSYQNSNLDFYKSLNFYILIFYYSLLVCYFIFTPFFQEERYKNTMLVSLIILYIFIPYILGYILELINSLYEYILESNNLVGDIISYPYIIEDREKYE